jgi:transcriptional regulator with XRE-family HTH domain
MDKIKDPLIAAIAAELEDLQHAAKLSDIAIARATGIPVQSVRRYINGERELGASRFILIADALGVSASTIATAAKQRLVK